MTTDNPYFLKGSHKDHNVITYEKGLAKSEKMTISNITRTVMKGFGTGVGGFSNTATILYAMAAIFNTPEKKHMYDIIMTRIKLLREIVGQEIDRIKGADKPSLPSEWKQKETVLPTDSPEEKRRKFEHNAMVVSKKPYFFRYLYPELNQKYKQFEASYNQVSRDMFGIKFKKLMKQDEKTEEQLNLIKNYRKYSPLIMSNCTMNILCRAFESIDFDIRFAKDEKSAKKPIVSMLPTFEDIYRSSFSEEKFNFVKGLYKQYNARKQVKQTALMFDTIALGVDSEDYKELRQNVLTGLIEDLQRQLENSQMPGEEFLFYCNRVAATYASFNWGFAWDVLEDQIVKIIPFGTSYCVVRDPHGVEYLGDKYALKEVSNKDELLFQKLFDSLFYAGDPGADTGEIDVHQDNNEFDFSSLDAGNLED